MSKSVTFIGVLVLLILSAATYGWYLYVKRPPDTRMQVAEVELTASDLVNAFRQDEKTAGVKYIDKLLLVNGNIKEIQYDSIGYATVILNAGDPLCSVVCSLYKTETAQAKKLLEGSAVRVKGKCTGILMDVILNNCSIVK